MTQPPPPPPPATPTPPAAPPAPPASTPAAPPATPTRTRRFPAWMKNPQVMGGFGLLLILAEIIAFGLLGLVWFLIVNVIVWSVLWMALLAWRRRGRGGRGGLLAMLLGRGRRTGGRGQGGASRRPGASTGTRGRGLFRRSASPSTGTGSTGTRGRLGRLFGRTGTGTPGGGGRAGGSRAGTGTGGRGSSASPSGGGWRSRRRRDGDASRSHSTRDGGVDETGPKGKGRKRDGRTRRFRRWAAGWLGVDDARVAERDAAEKAKKGDKGKDAPKPDKSVDAPGPKPGPGPAPEPRGSEPGREPWNEPAPEPEPIPAPANNARRDGGSTHMPANTSDASLHGWAGQLRATEAAADAVRTRFIAAETAAAEATTAATKAKAIHAEASTAAHAAEAAEAEDKPRLQAIARTHHEAAQRAARVAAEAAEAARRSADRALDGKAGLAKDLKDLAAYGGDRLRGLADPAVVAHAETAARQAANANTSDDWTRVSTTTAELYPIYLRRHGGDAARAEDPRGGGATEKLADHGYYSQGH